MVVKLLVDFTSGIFLFQLSQEPFKLKMNLNTFWKVLKGKRQNISLTSSQNSWSLRTELAF